MTGLAAVVLAGGQARRLGGRDKLMVPVDGRSLLERTLAVVRQADPVIVVGPRRAVSGQVLWTREEPPGGGPLAGLAAGLREVPRATDLVAVLAADHPHLTASTLARLLDTVAASAGAVLMDQHDVPQWLVGVWRTEALRQAIPARPQDLAVRSVLAALEPERVRAVGAEASDVDTPADLRRAKKRG